MYTVNQMSFLHPRARPAFEKLADLLGHAKADGRTPTDFRPFETWRSPERQLKLWKEGRTKAPPWSSDHQYGLAVDFVPFPWNWDGEHDWDFLENAARLCGLQRPWAWDKVHIRHPLAERLKAAGLV